MVLIEPDVRRRAELVFKPRKAMSGLSLIGAWWMRSFSAMTANGRSHLLTETA